MVAATRAPIITNDTVGGARPRYSANCFSPNGFPDFSVGVEPREAAFRRGIRGSFAYLPSRSNSVVPVVIPARSGHDFYLNRYSFDLVYLILLDNVLFAALQAETVNDYGPT